MTVHPHHAETENYSSLDAADVVRAASTLDPVGEDSDRITVVVAGDPYDPLDLFARAAKVEPDRVRLRTALDVLARLDFKPPTSNDPTPSAPPPPATDRPRAGDATDAGDTHGSENGDGVDDPDGTRPDMTPQLAQQMQRLRGEWVAVKRGRLLAHAPKLRDLLAQTGDQGASVLFVPLKDEHSGA